MKPFLRAGLEPLQKAVGWGGTTCREALLLSFVLPMLPCFPVFAGTGFDDESVRARVREAAIAVAANLRSGFGEGTFRQWSSDGTLTRSMRFQGAFEGRRRYLRLEYQTVRGGEVDLPDKLILVSDGDDLFSSAFSDRFRRCGAEGSVRNDNPGAVHNVSGGFPLGVRQIVDGIVSPDALEGEQFTVEELANGNYRLTVRKDAHSYKILEAAPELGWLVSTVESYWDSQLSYRWAVVWRRTDDVWHTWAYRRESYVGQGGRYEIEFDTFQPNVVVPAKLFTLSALELPPGARILDKRPPAGAKKYVAKVYRWPGGTALSEKRADRLIEQLKSVAELEPLVPVEKYHVRLSPWWAAIIALLGLAGIVLVWLARHRAAARDRMGPPDK